VGLVVLTTLPELANELKELNNLKILLELQYAKGLPGIGENSVESQEKTSGLSTKLRKTSCRAVPLSSASSRRKKIVMGHLVVKTG
jgi:hypothetical protein